MVPVRKMPHQNIRLPDCVDSIPIEHSDFECAHGNFTKGSLGYLSSMYSSTSLVLGEVAGPFPEIENWESRTET